jgi:hypothetical protein
LLVRRAIATAVFLLVLVLLLLGIRGCLSAREERAFENYASDLSSIGAENQSISGQLFGRLQDPGQLTPLQFEAEIKADRGAMSGLIERAKGLDAPGDLAEAQELVELAYELRGDGLSGLSESIATAVGDTESDEAIDAVVEDMRLFVTGDVVYARALQAIESELAEEGIEAGGEGELATEFLPAEPNWLDAAELRRALGEVSEEPRTPDVDQGPAA